MVNLWTLVLCCVLGRLGISNGNPISDVNDVVYDNDKLGGNNILDMGKKFDNPLMRLIGKAIINMKEKIATNMNKTIETFMKSETEQIINMEEKIATNMNKKMETFMKSETEQIINTEKKIATNMNKSIETYMQSEKQQLVDELCRLHPCTEWSGWTDCPAKQIGDFSMVSRNRTCGYTSSLCTSAGASKTETETKVCDRICVQEYNYTPHGFCLKFFDIKVNKTDAETTCQKDGGHVVNINSQIKSDDVHAILQNYNMEDTWIWMDGYRKDVNAPWEYTYGSASVNFSNWAPGQPNKNGPELCMIRSGVGHWWDTVCTQLQRVICELPR